MDNSEYAIDDPAKLEEIRNGGVVSKAKLCDEIGDTLKSLPPFLVANIANDVLLIAAGEAGQRLEFKYRGDDEFEIVRQ